MGRSRRRRTVVTKAIAPTPQATFTPQQVLGMLQAVRTQPAVTGALVPLPRLEPQVAFGPGVPLIPGAIDPLGLQGRPEPRRNEYPVTANLPGVTDRLVPWSVLRDAAERIPLFRKCIEIRKREVATSEWAIAVTKDAVNAAREVDGGTKVEIERNLRDRLAPEIARCTTFWQEPDRDQGYAFSRWITALLEDHLVLDAVAIYPRRTRGSAIGAAAGLYAMELIAGETIKPLRDHRGGRPLPPNPAYQQILHGFPRGEFVADTDADGNILNGYAADRLIYLRANTRSFTPYGLSAVEQALTDGDLYLKRMQWMGSEYTDGVMPTGWLRQVSGVNQWTPQQLADFERQINDVYGGQSGSRHRLRVLPPGIEPTNSPDVAERYKPDYDMHLIKLVAGHFDVTIAELGFTEQGGLGSTGWHEGQADVQNRRATRPDMRWIQETLTQLSRRHLGMPAELEFRFLGLDADDEAEAEEVTHSRVTSGRMTINEARDQAGQPRLDIPEADMPLLISGQNVTILDGVAERAAAGAAMAGMAPGVPTGDDEAESEEKPEPAETATNVAAKVDEAIAYRRWAKRATGDRRFECVHLTKAEVAAFGVDPSRVTFGGGADPKVAWPGWALDQQIANHWSPQLAEALTGALPADPAQYGQQEPEAIQAQIEEQDGGTLANQLAAILLLLMIDAALVGALIAMTLLATRRAPAAGVQVDWLGWTPGNTSRAQEILTSIGIDLDQIKAEAGRNGRQLAEARLRTIATTIAAGGSLPDEDAAVKWAQMVALTEVGRGAELGADYLYMREPGLQLEWLLDPRVDNCPACGENSDAPARPYGASWPSGHRTPPVHPYCRCHLAPRRGNQ